MITFEEPVMSLPDRLAGRSAAFGLPQGQARSAGLKMTQSQVAATILHHSMSILGLLEIALILNLQASMAQKPFAGMSSFEQIRRRFLWSRSARHSLHSWLRQPR